MPLDTISEDDLLDGIRRAGDPETSLKYLLLLNATRGAHPGELATHFGVPEETVTSLIETAESDGVESALGSTAIRPTGSTVGVAENSSGKTNTTETLSGAADAAANAGGFLERMGRRGFMLLAGSAGAGWIGKSAVDGTSPIPGGSSGGTSAGTGTIENDVEELTVTDHSLSSQSGVDIVFTVQNDGTEPTELDNYTVRLELYDDQDNELYEGEQRFLGSSEIQPGADREFEMYGRNADTDDIDTYVISIGCDSLTAIGVYCES